MRRTLLAISLLLVPKLASAVVQPNGQIVPGNPSVGGEQRLDSFFAARGEPIDWIADASLDPDTFAPRCGFTAEFVLNQAGRRSGIAWYNVDPAATVAPSGSELQVLVPAGAPVGTKISGADIAKNPAYKGGLIGFALLSATTNYSQRKWNVVCTACPVKQPWILALTYQSKKVPNAYYLAFEDGAPSASSLGNDGDYNDAVFFVTGVSCPAAGTRCDTGKKGICALGANSCENGKTVCREAVAPAEKQCNGLDNDCDGEIDDGPCPTGTICTRGACVEPCGSGEFRCGAGLVCDRGVCVEPSCENVECPAGQTCAAGACVDACTDVRCPSGQTCLAGACVDSCAFLKCADNEVCEGGVCKPDCTCTGCGPERTCEPTARRCVATVCVGKNCGPGTRCDETTGACVDACTDVRCPNGQRCESGACVPRPNTPSPGDYAGLDPGGDASVPPPGPIDPDDDLDLDSGKQPGASCACTTAGDARGGALGLALGALALAAGIARRRR
jgi:MYXO-CTERM domain-containing protein